MFIRLEYSVFAFVRIAELWWGHIALAVLDCVLMLLLAIWLSLEFLDYPYAIRTSWEGKERHGLDNRGQRILDSLSMVGMSQVNLPGKELVGERYKLVVHGDPADPQGKQDALGL